MATTNKQAFKTKEISATSRASIKIGDSYYTFEASETRTVNYDCLPNNLDEAEKCIEDEKSALWDSVNAEVDNQIADTVEFLKKRH